MATALESGPVSFSGLLVADGAGRLSSAAGPADWPPLFSGKYWVNDDCFVEGVLEVAPGAKTAGAMHFRGIVVEQGRVECSVFKRTPARRLRSGYSRWSPLRQPIATPYV